MCVGRVIGRRGWRERCQTAVTIGECTLFTHQPTLCHFPLKVPTLRSAVSYHRNIPTATTTTAKSTTSIIALPSLGAISPAQLFCVYGSDNSLRLILTDVGVYWYVGGCLVPVPDPDPDSDLIGWLVDVLIDREGVYVLHTLLLLTKDSTKRPEKHKQKAACIL